MPLTQKQVNEIAIAIMQMITDEAIHLFTECGDKEGFCVDYYVDDTIIFGKTNKVKWTAKHGFSRVTSDLPYTKEAQLFTIAFNKYIAGGPSKGLH